MDGQLMDGLQVTAVSSTEKKTASITPAGTFDLADLANGEYTLKVESASHQDQVQCEETKVAVERNALNEVTVKCEVKERTEMEIQGGGSFALLAIVMVVVFVFVEREQLRLAFN